MCIRDRSKIANGVEALILAFALDIYAQTQGYPIVPIKFIDNIKARYEIYPDAPRLNDCLLYTSWK